MIFVYIFFVINVLSLFNFSKIDPSFLKTTSKCTQCYFHLNDFGCGGVEFCIVQFSVLYNWPRTQFTIIVKNCAKNPNDCGRSTSKIIRSSAQILSFFYLVESYDVTILFSLLFKLDFKPSKQEMLIWLKFVENAINSTEFFYLIFSENYESLGRLRQFFYA